MAETSAGLHVLLVEDDAVHGAHLSDAISRVRGAVLVGWDRRARALRERFEATDAPAPDLVMLDLGLPDASGVELVSEVHGRWPEARVLVVSVLTDELSVVEALRRGASGYVVKDGDGQSLTESIQDVLEDRHPISPEVARYLIDYVTGATRLSQVREGAPRLTRRELDILHKFAEGLSYSGTAAALDIATATVQTHIRSLYKKLEAHSKTQALARAREFGLL
jgi:DNA-binding NarL/FixJ family response regulator